MQTLLETCVEAILEDSLLASPKIELWRHKLPIHLRELLLQRLTVAKVLSDRSFKVLFHEHIRTLSLRRCNLVTMESFTFLAQWAINLVSLDLTKHDRASDFLYHPCFQHATCFPKLATLVLDRCNNIDRKCFARWVPRHTLTSLSMIYCNSGEGVSQLLLARLEEIMPNLEELRVTGTRQSLPILRLPRLRLLDIHDCKRASHLNVVDCITSCTQLARLNLQGVLHLNRDSLSRIFRAVGPRIESIDISGLPNLNDDIMCLFTRLANPETCRALHLGSAQITGVPWFVQLMQRFSRLETLQLRECAWMSAAAVPMAPANVTVSADDSMNASVLNMSALSTLSLAGCKDLTRDALEGILSRCPNLTSLNIGGITRHVNDDALRIIARYVGPILEHLDLAVCCAVTDEGLIALAKTRPVRLRYLSLYGVSKVTDDGVTAITAVCPALTNISLYGLRNLTDNAIIALSNGCPELEVIDITGLRHLTDRAIHTLVRAGIAARLRWLILMNCQGFTERAFLSMVREARHLKRITLNGCGWVTDQSVAALATKCRALRRISMIDCNGVQGASLTTLLNRCKGLVVVTLSVQTTITDEQLKELQALRPDVKIVII